MYAYDDSDSWCVITIKCPSIPNLNRHAVGNIGALWVLVHSRNWKMNLLKSNSIDIFLYSVCSYTDSLCWDLTSEWNAI